MPCNLFGRFLVGRPATARKLQKLDESTVLGPLAAIEDAPRDLTAMELVAELESIDPPAAPELEFSTLDGEPAPE